MKAVKQIIDYLRGRGVLTHAQLLELAAEGFLPWEEVVDENEEAEPPGSSAEAVPPAEDETYDVSYPIRPKPVRKPRHAHHKGSVLDASELAGRLEERSESWQGDLAGLVSIGRRLGASAGWTDAALAIRHTEPRRLYRAVVQGLKEHDPSLGVLWNSINLDDYRTVINGEGIHGPAVSAYRAVLSTFDHSHLGKHVWILREKATAAICNLMLAQHRLLLTCESIFSRHPERIALPIHRDQGGLAYWPFVLLYTARRGRPGARPLPAAHEHKPPRRPPDAQGWLQAWCHAVGMDPKTVTALLLELHLLEGERADALKATLEKVRCSASSPAESVASLYYDSHGLSENAIAAQLNIPEQEVVYLLQEVRQRLHQALEAEPALRLNFCAEPPQIQEMLVQECLRADPGILQDVVNRYYGSTADLLCPKNWD
jgi:hypothetical protein